MTETLASNGLGFGIRSERLRQGLTLAQVAEQAELSPSALSQIERGVTDPSIGSLRRIASALKRAVLPVPGRPQHAPTGGQESASVGPSSFRIAPCNTSC